MRLVTAVVLACLFIAIPVSAQQTKSAPALPYTPSLDPASMDRTVDPCVDFYEYSCGGWRKMNPIPADQTRWSVYGKLYEDNLNYLRGILEAAATAKDRDAVTQKIGDYYAACMNEAEIEKLGAKPLDPAIASHRQSSRQKRSRRAYRHFASRGHRRAVLQRRLASGSRRLQLRDHEHRARRHRRFPTATTT